MLKELLPYHKRWKSLSDAYNKSIDDRLHPKCPTCGHETEPKRASVKAHGMVAKAMEDGHARIIRELLKHPRLRYLVGTHELRFQSADNYAIEDAVLDRFPMAICDSESGMGLICIHKDYLRGVQDFLLSERKVSIGTICDVPAKEPSVAWGSKVLPSEGGFFTSSSWSRNRKKEVTSC